MRFINLTTPVLTPRHTTSILLPQRWSHREGIPIDLSERFTEKRDAFTKVCQDIRPEGKPAGAGEQQVYKDLIKNPKTPKASNMPYVQATDARVALTSRYKSISDAAFERLATRFRLMPEINSTPAILEILLTRNEANLAGQKIGSLVGKKP